MRLLSLFAVLLLLAACSTLPGKPATRPETKPETKTEAPVTARYRAAGWSELPDWPGEQLQNSWTAWLGSCKRLASRPDWQALCSEATTISTTDTSAQRDYFERNFSPWRIESSTGATDGLVTGYYEALLTGSLAQKPGSVPIYGVPDDLLTIDISSLYPDLKGLRLRGRVDGNKVLPYWSRADIDSGKAATQGKVLVWADDAVDAFFLQIQGSGRVQLEDGTLLRLGYADQNGHPYRSIGKWLVDNGEMTLDQASMQSIRAWAQAHPERLREMLEANPSFVFFRVLPSDNSGAIGALNVPLTDEASIAVDPKFVPLGSPVYLATTRPNSSQPMNRLVHAQDTGGAIRGPIRADFFWGFGNEPAAKAGKMKQRGQVWILWPRGKTIPEPKP